MAVGLWFDLERWSVLHLDRLGRRCGLGRVRQSANLETGERGELEAIFYLRSLGYVVTDRRWTSPESRGDLDLVAWDGETLVFVEVKTRTARDQTPASAAVDATKRRTLRELSRAYRRTLPRSVRPNLVSRVDLVSVYLLAGGTEFEILRGIAVELAVAERAQFSN